MKIHVLIILAACFVFSAIAASRASAAEKHNAILVKVDGYAKIRREDQEKTVSGKTPLKWGDKVIVAKNSTALVFYETGKKVTVTSTHEINEANAVVTNPTPATIRIGKYVNMTRMGGVRAAEDAVPAEENTGIHLLTYRYTSAMNPRPVFVWEAPEQAATFTLSLTDEESEEIWSVQTQEPIAAYPIDIAPLERNQDYIFYVSTTMGGREISASASFYLLDADDVLSVSQTVSSINDEFIQYPSLRHIVLAEYYKQNSLFMEATLELKELIDMDPNNIIALEQLAGIYYATGDVAAARQCMQIADSLKQANEQAEY